MNASINFSIKYTQIDLCFIYEIYVIISQLNE